MNALKRYISLRHLLCTPGVIYIGYNIIGVKAQFYELTKCTFVINRALTLCLASNVSALDTSLATSCEDTDTCTLLIHVNKSLWNNMTSQGTNTMQENDIK